MIDVQTWDEYLDFQDGISDAILGIYREGRGRHYDAGYLSEYATEQAATMLADKLEHYVQ